jgi:5-methylcytosine-specific restriction protein A
MSHPWYHTTQWRALRKMQLDEFPLCIFCLHIGREVPANTVDHKIEHKGNWDLFIDRNNHQSLCASCHSKFKKIQEKSGILLGCDINGVPVDSNHLWNK